MPEQTLKRLTILQVLPALQEGGVEQGTVEMAKFIAASGGRALVASSGGRFVEPLMAAGVTHIALPLNRKSPFAITANARRLADLIAKEQPDIIHARSRGPAWSTWLACKQTATTDRYITTFHGTYGAKSAAKRWYNSVMLKGQLVIANSAFISGHIQETYGVSPDRIRVAERGVDERYVAGVISDAQRAALRESLDVPAGVPLLLMTGRLTRWKGQHVLLEALSILKDRPWVAAFAGGSTSPGYANELKKKAELFGIADRVRWLGQRRDIPDLNAAATLAFSCSTDPEAFGRVAIEVMAMGTPIIATALGGSLETVRDGETGWLIEPNNPTRLAAKIRSALADTSHLAAMGRAARTHVLTNFTAEQCCRKEAGAYLDLLARNRQPAA